MGANHYVHPSTAQKRSQGWVGHGIVCKTCPHFFSKRNRLGSYIGAYCGNGDWAFSTLPGAVCMEHPRLKDLDTQDRASESAADRWDRVRKKHTKEQR